MALLHDLFRGSAPSGWISLSVAVVYEDSETHGVATRACELLTQQMGEDAPLTATWWRISLAGDPKLRGAAGRAIGSADLILAALRADRNPSPEVQAWFESWPLQSSPPSRLWAVLYPDDVGPAQSGWSAYLEELAGRKGLMYVRASLGTVTSSLEGRLGQSSRDLTGICMPGGNRRIEPYVHGGLNE